MTVLSTECPGSLMANPSLNRSTLKSRPVRFEESSETLATPFLPHDGQVSQIDQLLRARIRGRRGTIGTQRPIDDNASQLEIG
jgi:hypothetical protein